MIFLSSDGHIWLQESRHQLREIQTHLPFQIYYPLSQHPQTQEQISRYCYRDWPTALCYRPHFLSSKGVDISQKMITTAQEKVENFREKHPESKI